MFGTEIVEIGLFVFILEIVTSGLLLQSYPINSFSNFISCKTKISILANCFYDFHKHPLTHKSKKNVSNIS